GVGDRIPPGRGRTGGAVGAARAVPCGGSAGRRGRIQLQGDRRHHRGSDRDGHVPASSRKKGPGEGVVGCGEGAGSCPGLAAKRCSPRSSSTSTESSRRGGRSIWPITWPRAAHVSGGPSSER